MSFDFQESLPMESRNASTNTSERAGYRINFNLTDGVSVQHVIASKQAAAPVLQCRFHVGNV